MQPENFDAVRSLIIDTLTGLANHGFEADLIEAGINSAEFDLRENNTGAYPRGLIVMLRALGSWLYDLDPLACGRLRSASGQPPRQSLLRENRYSRI